MIGLLVRDKPELLSECLRTLRAHTLGDVRLLAHLDAPDPECETLVRTHGIEAIVSEERVGVAAGLNKLLARREPGEDFCRVDGDVTILTHDWYRLLSEGRGDYGLVAPVWTGNTWQNSVWDFLGGKYRASYIDCDGPPLGGIVFHPGQTVDALGGYRNHGVYYGCQERDYAARVRGLGLKAGYVTSVLVEHPPVGPLKGPRRQDTEDALKVFKRRQRDYELGLDLYEPLEVRIG